MASVFSVFKNHLFVSLYQIIRNLENGVSYTPAELHKALYGNISFHPAIEKAVNEITDLFFLTDTDSITLRVPFSLPKLPATTSEKEWLKTLLEDKTCQPFFPLHYIENWN